MRLTRAGVAVLGLLAVCVVLTLVASGALQAAALVVGALVVLVLAAEGAGHGGAGAFAQDPDLARGDYRRKREVYERDADAWRTTHRR